MTGLGPELFRLDPFRVPAEAERVSQTPPDGRRVMRGSGIIGLSPEGANRNFCNRIVNTICISIMAKLLPMHMRGPAPNGR